MRSRSARFDAEVQKSPHRPRTKMELVDPDGVVLYTFSILDGRVSYSESNGSLTTTLSATVADLNDSLDFTEETIKRGWIYGKDGDAYGGMGGMYGPYSQTITNGTLVPYGNEVKAYRGLEYLDGTVEYILLGTFALLDVEFTDSADGNRVINISGRDRSDIVESNSWVTPFNVALDANYGATIQRLVEDRLGPFWNPKVTKVFEAVSELTPKVDYGTSPGGNPWGEACTMARVIRRRLYFDRDGNVRLDSVPDPKTATPAWLLQDGPVGNLLSIRRLHSRTKSYNGIVVSGENSSAAKPVRGEAWDDITTSPTWVGGKYGRRPLVITTPLVKDPGMAQNLAVYLHAEMLALHEEVEVSFVPNPALEVTDVLRVERKALGVAYNYLISRMEIPLRYDQPATATLRRHKETGEF